MPSLTVDFSSLSQSSCLPILVLPVPICWLVCVMLHVAYIGILGNVLSVLSDRSCQIINRSLRKFMFIGRLMESGGSTSFDPPYMMSIRVRRRVDQAPADPPYSRIIPLILSGSFEPQFVSYQPCFRACLKELCFHSSGCLT